MRFSGCLYNNIDSTYVHSISKLRSKAPLLVSNRANTKALVPCAHREWKWLHMGVVNCGWGKWIGTRNCKLCETELMHANYKGEKFEAVEWGHVTSSGSSSWRISQRRRSTFRWRKLFWPNARTSRHTSWHARNTLHLENHGYSN
jgi:hypothetical protein